MSPHRARSASAFVILVALLAVATGATLECRTLWDTVVAREQEADLAQRLVSLQRAAGEFEARTGRPPSSTGELASIRPPVVARIPLDPVSRRPEWRLVTTGGRTLVKPSAAGPALDGSRYEDWWARPVGSTWEVVHGEVR